MTKTVNKKDCKCCRHFCNKNDNPKCKHDHNLLDDCDLIQKLLSK